MVECTPEFILEIIGLVSGVFMTILGGLYFWWRSKRDEYEREIKRLKDEKQAMKDKTKTEVQYITEEMKKMLEEE